MLRAGYQEDGMRHQTLSGTPQGGIASPILANIFLHEMDQFVVSELKPAFDTGIRRRINKEYQRITDRLRAAKRRGDFETAKRLKQQRMEIGRSDPLDPDFRRLLYVRYADDFLIGVIGSKTDAKAIKDQIFEKLTEIGLDLSEEKTVITNAAHGRARFLNYDIYTPQSLTHRRLNGIVQLSVPEERVALLAARYTEKGKPAHRKDLIHGEVAEIIQTYDMELRGYYNYFKLAYNVSNRLSMLKYTMWCSLMRTLANKMKSSVSKMARRYKVTGPVTGKKCIGIWLETDKGKRLIVFGDLRLTVDKTLNAKDTDPYLPVLRLRELTFRLKYHSCELCGTETNDLEAHHVRRLNDIRKKVRKGHAHYWQLVMASRHRKTLVVCRDCHAEIHNKA
jgi:hypothetical protein